ncbi:hypothetical protein Patl1_14499 [Pistacia atlantica]|uniref:Uncharacterized protein n=1 Tax=Pistacia atlantica TaxID=434234 RepID=A0ACC1AT61_9ROSI|nr:hypothetical protein Patl1_14499 [Pistacia atlantica]
MINNCLRVMDMESLQTCPRPRPTPDDFVAVLDELLDGEAKKRAKKFHSWEPMNVLKRHVCRDEGSFGGMCCVCGQRLEKDLGVPLGGLRLGNDDVEEYLKIQTHPLQDVSGGSLFMLDSIHMMAKLRPFVLTFLKEASNMFKMYIYTMGDRPYALQMAELLDPSGVYIGTRVISRDDGTQRHEKGLDVVLGHENAIVILDDTENAWKKHKDNLILMERCHFFSSSCDQFNNKFKSLSELKRDECELDGALGSVLKVLKQIHHMFFEELEDDIASRDVRQALKTVRKSVLKGCKIVFRPCFPQRLPAPSFANG